MAISRRVGEQTRTADLGCGRRSSMTAYDLAAVGVSRYRPFVPIARSPGSIHRLIARIRIDLCAPLDCRRDLFTIMRGAPAAVGCEFVKV